AVISKCNLYTTLKAGTEILRLRLHPEKEGFLNAIELGAPPPQFAKYANRMSAAGIPAFYGAFDKQTAIKETAAENNIKSFATIGKFRTFHDLVLVDFTKLPPTPSIFESNSSFIRHGLRFLRSFLSDFTSPIEKDGREHIEYVPTQIVAEYLRFIHQKDGNINIDGILYRSARQSDTSACVLFINSDQSVDPGKENQMTTLVLTEVETFKLE
ncbi:MAG: RES family NAD+ phosphorylase, partial [Oscillospiraceae bacterium]